MENIKRTHEELQNNIPDLKGSSEKNYLYHEGYVYYSFEQPGARDATGWVSGGEVFKRVKDDGTEVTAFDKTYNKSVETASSRHMYSYSVPAFADGYVYFKILYSRSNDWSDDKNEWITYRVKADGISDLE
ncbi:MAG: hypothetical protein FWD40_05105 [Treponema sp.]|nr:hypothetical protein [Treponema sp.]